jgi:hypothetical protein
MTVGLPGTGIGGIFYLLLAVCMPIRESVRTLKRRTNLRRWGFIILQLLFVLGVVAAMWSELWLLNRLLIWTWGTLKVNGPLLIMEQTFRQTKLMALASASASFVSLTFVIAGVHVLRFFVHRTHRGRHLATPKSHTTFQILESPALAPDVS